jgi:hypothetical protein
MYPFEGNEAELKVNPGENDIIIMRRSGRDAGLSCSFILKQIIDTNQLIANAIASGDKTQVTY